MMGAWREGQVWSWVDWAFSLTLLIWSDGETLRDSIHRNTKAEPPLSLGSLRAVSVCLSLSESSPIPREEF